MVCIEDWFAMTHDDLRLVRLVAGRYGELQGLRRVVDAASLVLMWLLLQLPGVQQRPRPYQLALLTWAALTMWSTASAMLWYRARFGSTPGGGTREAADRADVISRTLLLWIVTALGGAFGAVLPLLTVYAAWIAWRDRPYRAHWLLLVLVGTIFSVAFYSMDSAGALRQWEWRFVWTAAPTLAMVGLLDHRLLARAMHLGLKSAPEVA
jgi:hypothetical protein